MSLSPIATLVLVALTLFGALPVYHRVADESPHGEGSIAMLERLLSFWKGKLFVLALLGFAATDFVITMTLSAADASAHLVENPDARAVARAGTSWRSPSALLALLGGCVPARVHRGDRAGRRPRRDVPAAQRGGDRRRAVARRAPGTSVVPDWTAALTAQHGSPVMMVAVALLVFPKLALGLSGFETGVAVMPHVRGDAATPSVGPSGRIRGTRRLLTSRRVDHERLPGHQLVRDDAADPGAPSSSPAATPTAGRWPTSPTSTWAPHFGALYDVSTIAILWFAGASAMAGLLNLIPRYLPRYGMAPEWAGAVRPLVLVLTGTAFLITWIFDADVDAQGGAYATGVLVLITSAAVAVTLAARRRRASADHDRLRSGHAWCSPTPPPRTSSSVPTA